MAKDNSLDITHPKDGKDVYIGSDWKEITYQAQDGTRKHATIRMGYEIIERTIDKKGQFLLIPDMIPMYGGPIRISLTGKSSSITTPMGESAPFLKPTTLACELKTDMNLERLPSGKFETNELVLELAILSYNILRMIGQEALGKRNPRLKRRRHRTVIYNLINMACHVTEHARKPIIGLGKINIWRDVFRHVYYAFEYFAPLTRMTKGYLPPASL